MFKYVIAFSAMDHTTLDEARVRQLVSESDPARRVEAIMQFVMDLRVGEAKRFRELLRSLGSEGHVGAEVAANRRQILDVLQHEEDMHPDVERGSEQFAIINMNDAPEDRDTWGTSRHVDRTQELGWSFDAELIELDGEFGAAYSDQPHIYFLVDGEVDITIGDKPSVPMTRNAQAAIPAGTSFKVSGHGKVFALHMHAEKMRGLQPEVVVGNFDDVPVGASQEAPYHAETAQCPCGPSRRIQLIKHGWGLSTHLTTMGLHVNETTYPLAKGHEHFTTLEAYYIARIHEGKPIMTIDGMSFPLSEEQLILVPRGVMHDIEGGKVDVRILVIGGHDDEDFRREDWRHVRDKK
ncbi:hypothetical protein A3C37_04120 [Candidatus Peribacteria bacterium RIFCSPHIGHO2_02_FULL_53_20]|nr:MAG: hypothetical protein A3C37_04120 [Candidatus Peribacteria bacterium RIFCSPHIGHO2_02_FULL_53_20]OGJ74731.1 MAG: hypothetical protein A3G69_04840 [Candidatus Peribacteria bacterium RIFCSPLOWO2_12_FULL_53_10]